MNSDVCLELTKDFYNSLAGTNYEHWVDIPTRFKLGLVGIPKLVMLRTVLYYQLLENPDISIRQTVRKYDVSYEQSFKAHNHLKDMKSYQ